MPYQAKSLVVQPGSIADKLDVQNPARNIALKIQDIPSTNPDQDISLTGEPCRLVLEIGHSKYVEISGIIRPACLPSIHR